MERAANEIKLKQIRVTDQFWSHMQNLVMDVVIPYQEKILNDEIPGVEKSHAFANFRIAAGLEEGDFYGMVFQDSDVAKWLEGVAYALAVRPDADLEKRADDIIDVIGKAQLDDGYLNTYFTIKGLEKRWTNLLECHEMYCAGHMMEAAVAYYEVTGKDKLLKIMEKMTDHMIAWFGEGKHTGIPGHQEIEIGLMRMYHATGDGKYRKLAQYFIDERGRNPHFFAEEAQKRDWNVFGMDPEDTAYNQSFAPVREQKEAVGHSVRAVYMYRAMADLAAASGDEALYCACKTLWDNITQKKMYVTGGIGASGEGEAFSVNYDLPNDMAYAETCAAIGLVFFAKSMLDIEPDGKYADVMERAIYNGTISGMQADGKKFFYVNPLEVQPGVSGKVFGYKAVLPERPEWYSCACCPPNLVRMVASLGRYAWSESETVLYSHLFLGQAASFRLADITVESEYPWNGHVSYCVSGKTEDAFTLAVHIPNHIRDLTVTLNGSVMDVEACKKKGYLYITKKWGKDEKLVFEFPMKARRVYANAKVREDAGRVALMRGPFVYCFEGIDQEAELQQLRIPRNSAVQEEQGEGVLQGAVLLKVQAIKAVTGDELYSEEPPKEEPCQARAIPYYLWANRGLSQMRVWMNE